MFYRYSPLLNLNITNFLKNYVDGYIKHGDLSEGELAATNCTNGVQWILNVSLYINYDVEVVCTSNLVSRVRSMHLTQ